jgi:pimeloyl-ACP methyl ester carboxylesterase
MIQQFCRSKYPASIFTCILTLSLISCGFSKNSALQKKTIQYPIHSAIEYIPCWTYALRQENAKCGLLSVPSDYKKPNSIIRKISFAIMPALKPAASKENIPEQNPMIFFVGGPGSSGTFYASHFRGDGSTTYLRHNRKLILIDYRGVGMSEPFLSCQDPEDMESCKKALDSSGMSDELRTATFVQDTDLLLKNLGYDKVSVYAGSYGTRVALTMMRDRPERLSHVIIDGVFPPEVNGFSQGSRSILAGLNKIAERCETNNECVKKLGDIRGKIENLADRWVDLEDVGYLLSTLATFSHHPAGPLLAHKLSTLSADDGAKLLLQYSEGYETPADKDSNNENLDTEDLGNEEGEMPELYEREDSFVMALGIVCSEEAAFIDQQPLNTKRHGFSGTLIDIVGNFSVGAPFLPSEAKIICKKLGISAADPVEIAPVRSAIPTLVLSGGADLQTSFEWGELAASRLSNAQHYIFPFSDHMVATSNPCAMNITGQFADNPTTLLNISCLRKEEKRSNRLILSTDNILKDLQ